MAIVAQNRLRPTPLEPVGDRVEQIGERHAQDEGQQDVAEDPQEEEQGRERAEPERRLTPEIHACPSFGSPGPPAMWRTHSTR